MKGTKVSRPLDKYAPNSGLTPALAFARAVAPLIVDSMHCQLDACRSLSAPMRGNNTEFQVA